LQLFTLEDHSLVVWPSAKALALFIVRNENVFKDKVVLDLGTGIGVSAIAALQAKAAMIYLCDLPFVLERFAIKDERFRYLPWDWTKNEAKDIPDYVIDYPPDILIAADVLYEDKQIDDVFASISAFLNLKPSSFAYIVIHKRLGDFCLEMWLNRWNIIAEWVNDGFDDIEDVEEIDSLVMIKMSIRRESTPR
jgi:methyltransferase-like protein 23